MSAERGAAAERAADALRDWHHALGEITDVEARMLWVLNALELTELVTTITGLSAVDAADSPVTPPGSTAPAPGSNTPGSAPGPTNRASSTAPRRSPAGGRPALRTAAWRAIWGALRHNPVYFARFTHLTTRAVNPLRAGQARTAIAAALLRQLHVVVTRRVAWDPAIAAGTAWEVAPQTA